MLQQRGVLLHHDASHDPGVVAQRGSGADGDAVEREGALGVGVADDVRPVDARAVARVVGFQGL